MAQLALPQTPFSFRQPVVPEPDAGLFTIDDLDPRIRAAFPRLKSFNRVQLGVAKTVMHTDDSIVVNAPTGSGKTLILELAILRLSSQEKDDFRIVYLAPTRSLCAEKYQDWKVRFGPLGISCVQFDGDSEVQDTGKLNNYRLILSTPEKWEVFTRHWDDQSVAAVLRPVKLFLIDEIQVLNDSERGANLELVVSRMKYIDARIHRDHPDGSGRPETIRFIAVSACVPNVDDFARWLKSDRNVVPFTFDETNRATNIERHVFGYPATSSPFKVELNLNYKLPAIIEQYARHKPTLVFCTSRKSTESTARFLSRCNMKRTIPSGPILTELAGNLANKNLQEYVTKGVAFHHAGLLHGDRNQIESSFRAGHIAVLCSTSTLCMGVNLPAYLVIVKSTFNHTGKDYSDNYILQMIGRAGRAEFNEDGVAVIMTTDENLGRYRRIVTGTAPIESQLHRKLPEMLNLEVSHGIIYDQPAVMEWMKSTYFYVRAQVNPKHYHLTGGRDMEDEIDQLCIDTIASLETSGLIVRHRPNVIAPTVCGRLMARNQISFPTMTLLQTELKGTESLSEMLALLTRASEFAEYKCRQGERKVLNTLNAPATTQGEGTDELTSGIRFRCPGRICTTGTKVYCLVQAVFGNTSINDHGLHQEAVKIISLGGRISRFVVGLLSANRERFDGGCFRAMVSVTTLQQCFQTKLWENSPFLMKQLGQIGPKLARHLADRGKVTFQDVRNSDPREIEWILKKQPPFGNDIVSYVTGLPEFAIRIVKNEASPPGFECLIEQRNTDYDPEISVSFSVLVGDSGNRILLYQGNLTIESIPVMGCRLPLKDTSAESITAHLICQEWSGLDCSHTLSLTDQPIAVKHHQTTITHYFPNQSLNKSILPMELPSALDFTRLRQSVSMMDESLMNSTAAKAISVTETNIATSKLDYTSSETNNSFACHLFGQKLPLRSILKPTSSGPQPRGLEISIPSIDSVAHPPASNDPNPSVSEQFQPLLKCSPGRPFFRSGEFLLTFQPGKCTLRFTLCSPVDEILGHFNQYNVFASRQQSIPRLPEEPHVQRKNFDLGPSSSVICSDEDE